MDLDIIQSTKEGEITQFLCDVRDYFKASLATSEYENTSNMFYVTASESTEHLLKRCECLLSRLTNNTKKFPTSICERDNCKSDAKDVSYIAQSDRKELDNEDVSYLDMTAGQSANGKKQTAVSRFVELSSSGESDKMFRCSTLLVRQNKSFLHRLHDAITATAADGKAGDEQKEEGEHHNDKINSFDDEAQIYDICQVTTQGSDGEEDEVGPVETHKAIAQSSHSPLPNIDCPYIDLPAGHLSIKKSIKYGQLTKIEKRLFFDQNKKCYCGILNDWLLCYADGPTSNMPTVCLYLKIPGIEIEHFGEGKRRDVCFQITTSDPNKRFVFQAVNEIDAKEWIHAIEAAIRSDNTDTEVRNSSNRKLPTPPVMKKITFVNSFQGASENLCNTSYDGIYEEPSPLQQVVTKCNLEKGPKLPQKQANALESVEKFEYDIPKCPPQPIKDNFGNAVLLINPYENNETNSPKDIDQIKLSKSLCLPSTQKLNYKLEENLEFQAKVKDVHSKLTSQLSSGPNMKKSLKKSLSSTSPNSSETLSLTTPSSPIPENSELKKLKKKSITLNSSQKMSTEKASVAKSWFLNRLSKTTSSTRSNSSSPLSSPSKCKLSEKENLLNSSSDIHDGCDTSLLSSVSSPVSPILKTSSPISATSKVNMIINQLEASGHLSSMFNVDAVTSLSTFCDEVNNYEPIMTVSTPLTSPTKKISISNTISPTLYK